MFLNVPESRHWVLRIKGQPVPYPAADYAAVGRVTRYMADLSREAWQEYTLGRVIAAVAAGADGITFDNGLAIYGRSLLEEFTARALAEARKRPRASQLLKSTHRLLVALQCSTSQGRWRHLLPLRKQSLGECLAKAPHDIDQPPAQRRWGTL
jgi:hypothetical protein